MTSKGFLEKMRKKSIDELMDGMPVCYRYFWCESKTCACLGCANKAGGLVAAGYSKEDWQAWIKEHPKKDTEEG